MTRIELPRIAALGARLRGAGLTTRGLAAWLGTARASALPARLEAMPAASTPAAAILALFVAGAELERDRLRSVPDAVLEPLIDQGLIERAGGRLRAPIAILPVGPSLLVCDRLDAAIERDLVCWPDDSSHHLTAAIPPGRRGDWLDLGCGSAFAPLAQPQLARRIAGVDINPRAVRYAQLGAALSGITHVTASLGDIGDGHEPAELVTCNAPMPDPDDAPGPSAADRPMRHAGDRTLDPRLRSALPEIWRHADPGFFTRLWPALARAVRPGGLVVVHGACAAMLPVLADAPGERVVAIYTPDDVPGFAVAWWRPDAPRRFETARRALTRERPHIDARDRQDALGGVDAADE